MIYILSGDENYLIKKELNKITAGVDPLDISSFDNDDPLYAFEDFYNACITLPLFAKKQFCLLRNPAFLIKKASENEEAKLLALAENPPYDIDIIFYFEGANINNNLKVTKAFINNANVKHFAALDNRNFQQTASMLIGENIQIDRQSKDYLINAPKGDLQTLANALKILKLYPEELDYDTVKHLIAESPEENLFKFINAITDKSLNRAIDYLHDLYDTMNSPALLISSLSGQLRFLYQVAVYHDQHLPLNEIKQLTNTKSDYRIQSALNTLNRFTKDELLKILSHLADLDEQIKSDDGIDPLRRLELFTIKLIRGKYAIN